MSAATLSVRDARRLALAKAGFLKPEWVGLPHRVSDRGEKPRDAAHAVIRHFGYLQLDTIAVTGARTHGIVLASRLAGFDTGLAEKLLRPGAPLFEYWGHEASWLPLELYPALGWRRERMRDDKHVRGILGAHPVLAGERLVGRVDLKADRKTGTLRLLSLHYEAASPSSADREAVRTGLNRYAGAVRLRAPAVPSRGGTSGGTSARG